MTKRPPSDAIIAVTDVYTGTADFTDAADAKAKMTGWAGGNERFYPMSLQHDFDTRIGPARSPWQNQFNRFTAERKRVSAPSKV